MFVGVEGIEPTQPYGNGFTARPDSPTSAYSQLIVPRAGVEPA